MLSFTKTTTVKHPPPTELLFFLQQDEAERRVSQNELSGCGQAHDATTYHGYIICAERQTGGLGYEQFKFTMVTDKQPALQVAKGKKQKAEYLGHWFKVQLNVTVLWNLSLGEASDTSVA